MFIVQCWGGKLYQALSSRTTWDPFYRRSLHTRPPHPPILACATVTQCCPPSQSLLRLDGLIRLLLTDARRHAHKYCNKAIALGQKIQGAPLHNNYASAEYLRQPGYGQ